MAIEPTFKQTGISSPITEFALALAAKRDDLWVPSGTAIVISPYLALTAKHVIEGYWSRFEKSPLDGRIPGTFSILAFQIVQSGKTGQVWSVTKLTLSPFTDIAFLHLTNPIGRITGYEWRGAKLNLAPPPLGSRIAGFGYHTPSINIREHKDGSVEIEWHNSPTTTVGEVVEIYSKGRDSSMLSFPCYRTNARFEHGMSGGPVFNERGLLCGLICSGAETETDFYSHVTTLWPCMATMVDFDRAGFPNGQMYPVLELARHGFIRAEGWEKVVLGSSADGCPIVGFQS